METLEPVIGPLRQRSGDGPVRSPGMKYRHYAPEAPVVWVRAGEAAALVAWWRQHADERWVLIAPEPMVEAVRAVWPTVPAQSLGTTAESAARRLFAAMRDADRRHPQGIVVVWNTQAGLGLAVTNRVEKAATNQVEL